MFRSLKVSVTLGAAVLIAAPGCCCPNLLTSHSSPSEEVVVADYSGGCAETVLLSLPIVAAVVMQEWLIPQWVNLYSLVAKSSMMINT